MRTTAVRATLLSILSIFSIFCHAESLREVVRFALKTNPKLLATESVRLATGQQVRAAQAGYLPTIDVAAAYGREGSKNPTSIVLKPDDYTNLGRRESSVRINENIFRGFFDENNILRSRHRLRSSAYRVQQEVQNVALESVEKYLEVLRISIVERLAQRNLDVHQRIFNMIKKRTDKGISRKADLEQAKGRTASAKARLIAEQGRLKDARTEYGRVVGRDPLALTSPPPLPKGALPSTEDIAVELAERRNPALKAARAEVDASVSRYKTAKSVNYPNFDFELTAKANYNVDGVRGNDKDYAALLRMNFNLFNGGGDMARLRETAHLLQESYEIRNRTHRQVVENMRLSWNALLTSQLRISDLKSHKDSAWETVLAYRKQFQLGQRTLLDLLDAENEWFLSSVAYINDKFNEFFAQYRILHSMGYLIQALRIAMPVEAYVEEDVVTFVGPDADVPGVPSGAKAATGARYDGKPTAPDPQQKPTANKALNTQAEEAATPDASEGDAAKGLPEQEATNQQTPTAAQAAVAGGATPVLSKVPSTASQVTPTEEAKASDPEQHSKAKPSLFGRMWGAVKKHQANPADQGPYDPLIRYVGQEDNIARSVINTPRKDRTQIATERPAATISTSVTSQQQSQLERSPLYRKLQKLRSTPKVDEQQTDAATGDTTTVSPSEANANTVKKHHWFGHRSHAKKRAVEADSTLSSTMNSSNTEQHNGTGSAMAEAAISNQVKPRKHSLIERAWLSRHKKLNIPTNNKGALATTELAPVASSAADIFDTAAKTVPQPKSTASTSVITQGVATTTKSHKPKLGWFHSHKDSAQSKLVSPKQGSVAPTDLTLIESTTAAMEQEIKQSRTKHSIIPDVKVAVTKVRKLRARAKEFWRRKDKVTVAQPSSVASSGLSQAQQIRQLAAVTQASAEKTVTIAETKTVLSTPINRGKVATSTLTKTHHRTNKTKKSEVVLAKNNSVENKLQLSSVQRANQQLAATAAQAKKMTNTATQRTLAAAKTTQQQAKRLAKQTVDGLSSQFKGLLHPKKRSLPEVVESVNPEPNATTLLA